MNIGVIGAGQMGTALVKGILRASVASPGEIIVADPFADARDRIAADTGVQVTTDSSKAFSDRELVIIAVKPQVIAGVLPGLAGSLADGVTLLSIVAGVSTERIEQLVTGDSEFDAHVVRAMPNTPALVGEGMSAICPGTHATDDDMSRAETVLSAVGKVVRVSESQINAVNGVSGSGPGYIYMVIEALADGGVKMGLPKPLALELATQTVLGTAKMVIETGEHPTVLRDKVTSPGGTTIAAIHVLEEGALRATLMSAVEAAALRAEELG
jgi:pyrroline-5-carboxylate reductase